VIGQNETPEAAREPPRTLQQTQSDNVVITRKLS
jgi:hypothetical protein